MKAFLQHHRLTLTPLSPIHIGCGEDFEPTNYVIDEGLLFGFDPSHAALAPHQRQALLDLANRASLLGLQRFFRDHAEVFKPYAQVIMPVSAGVNEKYQSHIGRAVNLEANGNQVFNRFMIERASYTGAQQWPYVPGSSFKGALRTGILDALNHKKPAQSGDSNTRGQVDSARLEKRLLEGDFSSSPLRLLKIGDFMPATEPERRVMYAVNRKKKEVLVQGSEVQAKGIAARKESILHGQYRAFAAEAVLQLLPEQRSGKDLPAARLRPADFKQIAQSTNSYHEPRLRQELKLLSERHFLNSDWDKSILGLLNGELGQRMASGEVMLVRLGRYGGAECKTLSGNGVAQIKIMQGKGMKPLLLGSTKTVWLAAEHENEHKHLLPFGWALVEIDPQGDWPTLQAWCREYAPKHPGMAQLRSCLAAKKAQAELLRAELAQHAAASAAAAQAQELERQERQKALDALPGNLKTVRTFSHECVQQRDLIVGGNFKKQAPDPGRSPLYRKAQELVQQALASSSTWSADEKASLADAIEQSLAAVISPWEPKEQRKKFKLAALRGQT